MSSIAEKLTLLKNTKQGIKNAIIAKGVEVSDTDTFASYAEKIRDIGGEIEAPTIAALVSYDVKRGDIFYETLPDNWEKAEYVGYNSPVTKLRCCPNGKYIIADGGAPYYNTLIFTKSGNGYNFSTYLPNTNGNNYTPGIGFDFSADSEHLVITKEEAEPKIRFYDISENGIFSDSTTLRLSSTVILAGSILYARFSNDYRYLLICEYFEGAHTDLVTLELQENGYTEMKRVSYSGNIQFKGMRISSDNDYLLVYFSDNPDNNLKATAFHIDYATFEFTELPINGADVSYYFNSGAIAENGKYLFLASSNADADNTGIRVYSINADKTGYDPVTVSNNNMGRITSMALDVTNSILCVNLVDQTGLLFYRYNPENNSLTDAGNFMTDEQIGDDVIVYTGDNRFVIYGSYVGNGIGQTFRIPEYVVNKSGTIINTCVVSAVVNNGSTNYLNDIVRNLQINSKSMTVSGGTSQGEANSPTGGGETWLVTSVFAEWPVQSLEWVQENYGKTVTVSLYMRRTEVVDTNINVMFHNVELLSTAVTTEWKRYSVTFEIASGRELPFEIGLMEADESKVGTLEFGSVQLEYGNEVTPYQLTDTSYNTVYAQEIATM